MREVSADAQELLEIAHAACDRMIRLINNILDLSKIEAGQIKLNLTSIDLADIAERVTRTLGPLATIFRGAAIRVEGSYPFASAGYSSPALGRGG